MAVPASAISPVELVIAFGVIEYPQSFHVIRINKPASEGESNVFIVVDKVTAKELSPYSPCCFIRSFLDDLFHF